MEDILFRNQESRVLEKMNTLLPFISWQKSTDLEIPISRDNTRIPSVCHRTSIGDDVFVIAVSEHDEISSLKVFSIRKENGKTYAFSIVDLNGYPTMEYLVQSFLYILIQYLFRKGELLTINLQKSETIH
jgi:hypothetical protein